MVIKKILLLILTVSIFTVSGNALERKKPLPLKELQNPNGPSYVPIPYPQTNDEVITDLKYYFNKRINPSQKRYSVGRFSEFEKTMRGFLEGKDVVIGEIFKVKNKLAMWEREYTFFIRLKTNDNIWLADICMDSDGHISGSHYLGTDLDKMRFQGIKKDILFKPYLDKIPIKKKLNEIVGSEINENEISSMQLVDGQCGIADMLMPAWEITLADGRIYYKSYRMNAFYAVESKIDLKSENSGKMLLNIQKNQYVGFKQTLIDTVLVLKQIWRGKNEY